jgi:hypothetical protein
MQGVTSKYGKRGARRAVLLAGVGLALAVGAVPAQAAKPPTQGPKPPNQGHQNPGSLHSHGSGGNGTGHKVG